MRRNPASNARTITVTEYGADPHGQALLDEVRGEAMSRLQGHGSAAYVGADGDPMTSFTGYATAQPHYTDALGGVANYNTYKDAQSRTIESSLPDTYTGADSARRIFADRLRRRAEM